MGREIKLPLHWTIDFVSMGFGKAEMAEKQLRFSLRLEIICQGVYIMKYVNDIYASKLVSFHSCKQLAGRTDRRTDRQ